MLVLSLLAGTALLGGGGTLPVAYGQEQTVQIDIPAGSLSTALNRLAYQTGLHIGYDSALVRGMTTPGLSGQYAPAEALDSLLAGTGLQHAFSDPRTVTLTGAGTADVGYVPEDGSILLDTITVGGEKLPRDFFRTYASVGVVTSENISDYNVQTLDQALNRLANVRAFPSDTGNNRFAIRGLDAEGVTQPSRAAPIISIIVDGAEQGVEATRRGSRGVWDVDQIEVLRGPQSTLQGRNALGGAVIVETKDPTWYPELIAEGDLATEDFRSGAFAVSTPIVQDQVAVRVAGQVSRETKDIDYPDPAIASLGEDEFEEIRAKVLVTPEALPGFRALFTISHTHDKPGWNAVTGPDFFARQFVDTGGSTAEFRDTEIQRYVAELSYEVTPDWEVTSVTALADTSVEISSPAGSSFDREDTRDGIDFSQDIRLTFESPDSPLSGVFGIYAGRFGTNLDSTIETSLLAPYGVPLATVQDLYAKNKTTSIAAYADLRYTFWDRWTLMGGGRLLRDEVSANYQGEALDLDQTLIAGFPVYGSLDEDNSVANVVFLPKIGLSFDLTETQTVSVMASRGYRAGFSEAVPGTTTINEVSPEFLWSYEVAYRSKWMDERLHFNVNAFYYDYEDQQILTLNPSFPGQTFTENSGKSHAYGAEIEARFKPFESLELFSSIGLLKTEFDEALTTAGNLDGNEFPESPTVTASIGGIWRHKSGFFAGADLTYTDGFYSAGDLANTQSRYVDAFTVVNAQIGYEFEHATITAYAKNLFDEQYLTGISDTGTQATVGEGMSLGIRAKARF